MIKHGRTTSLQLVSHGVYKFCIRTLVIATTTTTTTTFIKNQTKTIAESMHNTIEDLSTEFAKESATIQINPPKRTNTWGEHNSVVMATMYGNRMTNCQDVREIYAECHAAHSKDNICKTAASYFSICMMGSRIEKD